MSILTAEGDEKNRYLIPRQLNCGDGMCSLPGSQVTQPTWWLGHCFG